MALLYRLTPSQVGILHAAVAYYESVLEDRELTGEDIKKELALLLRANTALQWPVREK